MTINKETTDEFFKSICIVGANGVSSTLYRKGEYGPASISKIAYAPTSNCQIASIGNIEGVLETHKRKDESFKILGLLALLYSASRNQVLIDIREVRAAELVESIIKIEEFLDTKFPYTINQPYKNTTGTPMRLILLNIISIRGNKNEVIYNLDFNNNIKHFTNLRDWK